MSTTTIDAPIDPTPRRAPRPARRRLAKVALMIGVATGAGLALGACTPSAHQVEKKSVAYTHWVRQGRSVNWADVQCTEFVLQGSNYKGTCWAEGHEYAVNSSYSGDVASSYVTNSGGITEGSAWIKDANGVWSQFSWQF